jgi:hypothetical protein
MYVLCVYSTTGHTKETIQSSINSYSCIISNEKSADIGDAKDGAIRPVGGRRKKGMEGEGQILGIWESPLMVAEDPEVLVLATVHITSIIASESVYCSRTD